MIHPDTRVEFISDEIGFGVVATRLIPKGSIVWCLDDLDQKISPVRVAGMPRAYRDIIDKYAFRDRDGTYILCWDNSRFINHSFKPSCLPMPYDLELAVRDIRPGEELTDHYGALNIQEPFRALPENGTRHRIVYPDDILRHHRSWDRQLNSAFRHFEHVRQPLLPMLAPHHRQTIEAIAKKLRPLDSCLETWCGNGEALPA